MKLTVVSAALIAFAAPAFAIDGTPKPNVIKASTATAQPQEAADAETFVFYSTDCITGPVQTLSIEGRRALDTYCAQK